MGVLKGDARNLDNGSCHLGNRYLDELRGGKSAELHERWSVQLGDWSKFPIIRGPIFGFPL